MRLLKLIRGVFVGSGSDGMQLPVVCSEIIKLTGKAAPDVKVLYIGTAIYDDDAGRDRQCAGLVAAGVTQIDELAIKDMTREAAAPKFAAADAIVVSGGNTLFAVDTWRQGGVADLFSVAARRGCVLSGGSAGAIVAFDAGHSDSGDPDSFFYFGAEARRDHADGGAEKGDKKRWRYIRVPGLGLLPGLTCPHYDKVQSNGVLRADDFDGMLERHCGERGLGLDHWAALACDGTGQYSVLSGAEKVGSVLADGSYSRDRKGRPGLWVLEATPAGEGKKAASVTRTLAPARGWLSELLRPAHGDFVVDRGVDAVRAANPAALAPAPRAEALLQAGRFFPLDGSDPIYDVPLENLTTQGKGFGRFLAAHPVQGCQKVSGLNHQWTASHHKEPYFVTFRPGARPRRPSFSWRAERRGSDGARVFEVGEGAALSDVFYRECGDRWQLTFYGANRWKLTPDVHATIAPTEELTAFCSCYVWTGSFKDGRFINVNFGVGQGKGETLEDVCDKPKFVGQWDPRDFLSFGGVARAREKHGDPWMEYFPGVVSSSRAAAADDDDDEKGRG